jgi:copper(I)-binding protein
VTTPAKEGDIITGTLVFERAGTAEIEYEVMAPNAGMDH